MLVLESNVKILDGYLIGYKRLVAFFRGTHDTADAFKQVFVADTQLTIVIVVIQLSVRRKWVTRHTRKKNFFFWG